MEGSLLSAFRYFAKTGPLHCEAHKDKGLLTIVLNPHGLEALVDGKWVPMDVDELGRPLGPDCAVVFPGLTLEKASAGVFLATEHRVRNFGERMSIVAKLRCHPDARLDVPWALHKIRVPEDAKPEIFTVSDFLASVGTERSVNNTMKTSTSSDSNPPPSQSTSTSSVRQPIALV